MSELIGVGRNHNAIRWQLLTTVSILALLPCILTIDEAKADDGDHPIIWIELGGQLERQTGQGDSYDPPFVANDLSTPAYKPISPLQSDKPPLFSNGADAKLSFQPEGSDWVFSASVRYGRANGSKTVYQNAPGQQITDVNKYYTAGEPGVAHCCKTNQHAAATADYADTKVTHRDSHTILDFQAGKEVGLGMFGRSSESLLSIGVRFAQFAAKSRVAIQARPDVSFHNYLTVYYTSALKRFPQLYYPSAKFHEFAGTAQSTRSFHGLGPSISWNSSIALLGNAQAGVFSFDWGANAAVLFGRRIAIGQHHETGQYHAFPGHTQYSHPTASFDRSHTATIPNVGGFAGVSFKFPNAKVSVGYRGDFFFGAMDTGWDAEKTKTVGFYGPFASISFGIGG